MVNGLFNSFGIRLIYQSFNEHNVVFRAAICCNPKAQRSVICNTGLCQANSEYAYLNVAINHLRNTNRLSKRALDSILAVLYMRVLGRE